MGNSTPKRNTPEFRLYSQIDWLGGRAENSRESHQKNCPHSNFFDYGRRWLYCSKKYSQIYIDGFCMWIMLLTKKSSEKLSKPRMTFLFKENHFLTKNLFFERKSWRRWLAVRAKNDQIWLPRFFRGACPANQERRRMPALGLSGPRFFAAQYVKLPPDIYTLDNASFILMPFKHIPE